MVNKDLLLGSELFGSLNAEQLTDVADGAEARHFEKGDFLFHEHETAKHLYFIVSGRVGVLIDIGLAKKTNVFTVSKGGSLGWSALVPPYRLTASAKCMEPAEVILVSADHLRTLFDKDHDLALDLFQKVTRLISRRVKETRLQLVNLLHG